MRRLAPVWVIAIVLLAVGVAGASAASLQPVGNFDQPISIASAPEEPDRLLFRDGSEHKTTASRSPAPFCGSLG